MFWKIFKPLSEHFHIYALDTIGMGGSSRPKFQINDPEEADNYLREWLEAWRIKVVEGGLTGFVLAGHSFGGYVAGLYASKYHHHIKKLLMLSPAGVASYPPDYDVYPDFEARMKKQGRKMPSRCCFSCVSCCMGKLWGKCSPFSIMRCCGKCCV